MEELKNIPQDSAPPVKTKTQSAVRRAIRLTSALNPQWAADLGLNLFTTPLRRRKPRSLPEGTQTLNKSFKGKNIAIYNYGISLKKVLLVHGWEGAAADFSHFFEPLEDCGFEVVAVDLPGHGQSSFSQLNAVMAAELIVELEKEFGPFCAVIGHSFGAFSLGYALSSYPQFSGTPFVSIGSPTRLETVIKNFSKFVGLSSLQQQYMNARIEKNFNIRVSDFELGKFLKSHTGPSMVVHDRFDAVVPVERLGDIKKLTDSPTYLVTEGLGHNRILRDSQVVEKIRTFLYEFQDSRLGLENAIKFGV